MTVGMAEVIAAHSGYETATRIGGYTVDCFGCDWRTFSASMPNSDALHAAHVAEELAKAGYGKLPEPDEEYDFGDPTPVRISSAFLGFFQTPGGKA